jgi:K+-sensing histidine kinase KdpD
MFWQLAAAAVVGSLFYAKRLVAWSRNYLPATSPLRSGFVFATLFAAVASPLSLVVFQGQALPRFNDIFLIGIVLTAYLFRWEPSVYLLGISVLVSAWVLPPHDSFRVEGFQHWYRLLSFTIVSVFLVCLVTRTKARRQEQEPAPDYRMHGAAAGAD